MSTLITSVHIQYTKNYWRDLQKQFIVNNTKNYEYGVIVNGDNPQLYTNVIKHIPQRTSHLQCIELALDYFRNSKHDYFVLLDSDCWPIKRGWVRILENILGNRFQYAAPMRVENFDIFPHPSAFFMRRDFLDRVDFNFAKSFNLSGIETADVGMAMPQSSDGKPLWHPLIKTNFISPHPVYACVYGDLFYHHCAGSRGIGFRSARYPHYKHVFGHKAHDTIYTYLTECLISDPVQFISELRGVVTPNLLIRIDKAACRADSNQI